MTISQAVVVLWVQWMVGAVGLFWLARRGIARLKQPAERLRLVEFALIAAVMLPACLWVAPWKAWRLEVLAPVAEPGIAGIAPGRNVPTAGTSEPEPMRRSGIAPSVIVPYGDREIQSHQQGSADEAFELADHESANSAEVPSVAAATTVRSETWSALMWRAAAVAVGVLHGLALVVFLILRRIGWRQWRQLCRRAVPASAELRGDWDSVTGEQGRHVQLLISGEIDAPLLCGWLRPVVLVPRGLVAAEGSSLWYCLGHEWSHVVRGDFLVWRAVDTCQVLFWMFPGYWALRKELRLCQDMLADHSAAADAGDVVEYSALLVSLARQRLFTPLAGALTLMDQPSQLSRRVKMLLNRSKEFRSRTSWRFSLFAATAAGCVAVLVSAIQIDVTRAEAPQTAEKKSDSNKEQAAPPKAPETKKAEAAKYTCSVVDKETGKGLPSANVTVRRTIYSSARRDFLEETKHVTDADGKYEVVIPAEQVAEPSLYIELDVEHPDYASKKGFGYGYGMIVKNEKLGERPFFERTELFPGEAVTGTVLDPQGRPLPDVKVSGFSMRAGNDFQNISWTESQTDAAGKFRLVYHKGGDGVLWVLPKNYGGLEKFVAKQRGDLGQIKVTEGVRVAGQVTGVDQKPIAGVPVNLTYSGQREVSLPVATSLGRGVVTDAEGRFVFDPVPAGEYKLQVDEYSQDPLTKDRQIYKLPAVFLPKSLSLKSDSKPASVELQAVPHIVIHAQYLTSEGKKTGGHEFFLHGQIDGQFWFAQGRPDKDGTIALRVPHGLEQAQMQLSTNEHGALRYRRGPEEPLQDNTYNIQLGTLNDDIEGFEIIRYKAPIVLVSAVDPAGQPIKNLKLTAKYAKPRPQQYISFENGSDFRFEAQDNGVYRSSQMLPDEDVALEISAEGFGTVAEKFKLPEGETRELKVTLQKAAAQDGAKAE